MNNLLPDNTIISLIERQFTQKNVSKRFLYDAPADMILQQFHMIATITFHLEDEYFCGIRANHFLVEYGYSEDDQANYFVVTANHKGYRNTVCFKNEDPILDNFFEKLELTIPKLLKAQ